MFSIYKDKMYFTRHLIDLKPNLEEKQGEHPQQTQLRIHKLVKLTSRNQENGSQVT